jgi:hypothetical protein
MRDTYSDRYSTDLERVITAENVQDLGESIALCTLKHLSTYRGINFEHLYFGLVRDIHRKEDVSRPLSDGYDFAQTAMCFLCEYIGLPLGTIITDRLKHKVTIRHACYSLLANMMYRKYMCRYNEYGLKPTDKAKTAEPFEENNTEASHNRVDEIIDGMRLNNRQKTILDYYMEGFGVSEISRRMKIETSTVWRNRIKLQMKYTAFMRL